MSGDDDVPTRSDLVDRLDDGDVLFLDRPSRHYILAVWRSPDAREYRVQAVTPTLNDSQFGKTGTVSDIWGLLDYFPTTDPPSDVDPSFFPPDGVDARSTVDLGTYDARDGGSV